MSLRKLRPSLAASLSFPGTHNIQVPSSTALAFDTDFTAILSMKMETGDTSQRGVIGTTNGGSAGWEITLDANRVVPRTTLRGTTPHDETSIVKPAIIRNGEWVRLAAVCSTTYIRLYSNGVFGKQYVAPWVGTAGGDLYIGDRGSVGLADYLGLMSDIQLYSRVLTQAEIEADYFDGALHSDLAAHYKCDEGSGTDLLDSSGNGLDATFNAAITYTTEVVR